MLGELIEKALKIVASNSLRVSSKERSREGDYDVVSLVNNSGADLQISNVYLVSEGRAASKREIFINGQKESLPFFIKDKSSIDFQPSLDGHTYMLERGYVITIFNGAGFFTNINLPRKISVHYNLKSLWSEATRGRSSAV